MRIAIVSTWGSSCGIATYSEELTEELRKNNEVVVLAPAEPGSCMRDVGYQVPTVQAWTRQTLLPRFEQILSTAPGFDIVHFQHEHGLWPVDMQFIDVVRQVGKHAKVIVTLHTVLPYGTWQRSGFYDALKTVADGIIVHTPEAHANIAVAAGERARVMSIPHGTKLGSKGDRERGLKLLDIPEPYWKKGVFCLCFGFQGHGKNTLHTIKAFVESVTRRYHDNGVLVVSGMDCGNYFRELEATVAESGQGRRIFLRSKFTSVKDTPDIFAAADFGVLNTTSTSLSASGAAHVYARYGVPVAAAVRPIYMEIIHAGAVPFWVVDTSLHNPTLSSTNVIGALIRDADLRRGVGRQLQAFAEATSWDKIAGLHEEFYKRALG